MCLTVACQAPRGAATCDDVTDCVPSSAEPSGEVGETVPAPPTALTSTVIVSPPSSSTSTTEPMPTSSPAALLDDLRAVEARAQRADARLEQALLVLRGVVLEVLGEVAELARLLDRGDDLRAARAFELGELFAQRGGLLRGEAFVRRSPLRPSPTATRRVHELRPRKLHTRPARSVSTWPCSRATRETSACCSGSTSVMPMPPRPARPVRPTRCV